MTKGHTCSSAASGAATLDVHRRPLAGHVGGFEGVGDDPEEFGFAWQVGSQICLAPAHRAWRVKRQKRLRVDVNRPGFRDEHTEQRRIFAAGAATPTSAERRIAVGEASHYLVPTNARTASQNAGYAVHVEAHHDRVRYHAA